MELQLTASKDSGNSGSRTCSKNGSSDCYLPGVVDVDNDPRSDAAVDARKVLSQPLPLSTPRGVVHIWGQVDHMAGPHLCAVVEV